MKKTLTLTYPAAPERVATMLASEDYQRQRLHDARLDSATLTVSGSAEGAFSVTTAASITPNQLPTAAQRFIRSALALTLTESWRTPMADGARRGSLKVTVTGAPVTAAIAFQLDAADAEASSSRLTAEVDLSIAVPLLGRTLEEKAMSAVGSVLAAEEARAVAWLASH